MSVIKHLAQGINHQAGVAENSDTSQGWTDVIFDRPFRDTPDVTTSPHITGNAPKNGSIKWVNKYGFRYHFGGSSNQVVEVHWSATEKKAA